VKDSRHKLKELGCPEHENECAIYQPAGKVSGRQKTENFLSFYITKTLI
jgi:hypothetical protein